MNSGSGVCFLCLQSRFLEAPFKILSLQWTLLRTPVLGRQPLCYSVAQSDRGRDGGLHGDTNKRTKVASKERPSHQHLREWKEGEMQAGGPMWPVGLENVTLKGAWGKRRHSEKQTPAEGWSQNRVLGLGPSLGICV